MKIKKIEIISSCKICNSEAQLYGVIDFNDIHGRHNVEKKLCGQPIYYHKCTKCGVIYTNAFDDWSENDFAEYVYNSGYINIDPDFPKNRPERNFKLIMDNFEDIKKYHLLDFGCGSNVLVDLLKTKGVDATGWDPFYQKTMPNDIFDFVISFEVLEHTPDPIKTVSMISELLDKDNGKIFFSTLTNDNRLSQGMSDWYIVPRGGHVTYYSKESLSVLFGQFNMSVHHVTDGLHLAFRTP